MLIRAAMAVVTMAVALMGTTPVFAVDLDDFGRCLKRDGAVFYGAAWCPYCDKQRDTLGEAMPYVKYVECAEDGKRGETTAACRKAKVESYPTWTFRDGDPESGAQSLEELAARTGCELPGRRGRSADAESDD